MSGESATLEAAELARSIEAALAPFAGVGARAGLEPGDFTTAARWLVQAEQLGLAGFGVSMLLRDLERLGAEAPRADYAGSGADAPLALDAAGLPGPVVLAAAVRRATAAASSSGIGFVGIRGVGALGVLGLAVREAAGRGFFALATAQAPAMVAPWGGASPAIGTNPIAFAAPRAGAGPLTVDFATSALTFAAVRAHLASGEPLPSGAAIDAAGAATSDARAVHALLGESRVASLAGLFVELFAGSATGGRDATHSATRGAAVLVVNPALTGGVDAADSVASVASDWAAAGGHVPARFDALAAPGTPVSGTVTLSRAALAGIASLGGVS